jgi:molybdate transport repressor ModE-like protein
MAGSRGDKYYDVFLDYSVWLKTIDEKGIMGEGCIGLLIDIKESGSLKLAADKQEMSYRKAWGVIQKSEEMLGFKLVDKQRGGKNGGYSCLTADGEDLILAFDELKKEFNQSIKKITKKFFNKINK